MVNDVIPDHYPGLARVASEVNGAHVVALQHRIVDFVEFDQVIIAVNEEQQSAAIVQLAMSHAVAHAIQVHRPAIAAVPTIHMMDVAVLDKIPGGLKRLAIAAAHRNPACADVINLAVHNPLAGSGFPVKGRIAVNMLGLGTDPLSITFPIFTPGWPGLGHWASVKGASSTNNSTGADI